MEKLDLSDEVSIGGEQMKIADGIVCYSIAISDCVKEPNSLMALTFFKKTDQCSMFKDQIVFKTTTSACNKSMSWIVVLHFAVLDARHRIAQEWLLLQRCDQSEHLGKLLIGTSH